jgi:hypothetical protein
MTVSEKDMLARHFVQESYSFESRLTEEVKYPVEKFLTFVKVSPDTLTLQARTNWFIKR